MMVVKEETAGSFSLIAERFPYVDLTDYLDRTTL